MKPFTFKYAVLVIIILSSVQTSLLIAQDQLYGITARGGSDNKGCIFHYSPGSSTQVIDYSFPVVIAGSYPNNTELVPDGSGSLFGMTDNGGQYDAGVIFEYNPTAASYYKRFDFDGSTTGGVPHGALVLYNGKFYGTTTYGGSHGYGTIFEFDPVSGAFFVKFDFDNPTDGGSPECGLTYLNGKFYGSTSTGGINDVGTLFEWNPVTNEFTKKLDFDFTNTGGSPKAAMVVKDGKLYGSASQGGNNSDGVLFEWDPVTNVFTKKIDLDGMVTGSFPLAPLALLGGTFYGTTAYGGVYGSGVIFSWNPATNILTREISFDIYNLGAHAYSPLVYHNNKFIGQTIYGGAYYGGTLFEWEPGTNTISKKHDFLSHMTGYYPSGTLVLFNGKFYGTAKYGGNNNEGTIYEWDPNTSTVTKKEDFGGSLNGTEASGYLTAFNGKLYGTTTRGGLINDGVLFEWDPSTSTFTKKLDFIGTVSGRSPQSMLVPYNNKLYGMTYNGGAFDYGVIYEYDPLADSFIKKRDFGWFDGRNPDGSLTEYNGKFYATTALGGSNEQGVIFEWDPVTNIYQVKHDFGTNPDDGQQPTGDLVLWNGKFYGMTRIGGVNGDGTIFEWDPVSNILTKKIDLSAYSMGMNPIGTMALHNNKFYGMTYYGGINDAGVIFEWDPVSNNYLKKIDFDFNDGGYPGGKLVYSDNKFYGLTSSGGILSSGVLFDWDPITNIFTKQLDFNLVNGSQPNNASLIPFMPDPSNTKTVTLSYLLLESLYDNSGTMRKTQDENGDHFPGNTADLITVELHDENNYQQTVLTFPNVALSTSGDATFSVPESLNGSYWITISHRNSIAVVSAAPVDFSIAPINFTFDSYGQVYGANLRLLPDGYLGMYAGDANLDGLVDSSDMILVDNEVSNFSTGYIASDINGDGLVDSSDMIMVDNNAGSFISVITP